MGRVLAAIGELVLDVTIAPEGQLRLDDDTDASISIGGGGQAANFCAWAASVGEQARLITRVGDDDLGRRLVAEIAASGVDVRAVVGEETTGAIAVLLGPSGERTFARQRGAAIGLAPGDLRGSWFADLALLHVPGYSLFMEPIASAARAAVELARSAGAVISVDLSSAEGIRSIGAARMAYEVAVLAPEILFATEAELTALGAPLEGLAKVPVLKLGARGCSVYGRVVAAPRVSPDQVIDGNGAGDAFAAAFCASYVEGATPLEAAGRAVLVSARALQRSGARP